MLWAWLLVLGAIASVTFAQVRATRVRLEQVAMDALMVRQHPDAMKALNRSLRNHQAWMFLVREFQIAGESITIALTSTNPETARGRYLAALQSFSEAEGKYLRLISAEAWLRARAWMNERSACFEESHRLNAARGLIEKAEKLKTQRGRDKYHQQAVAILQEGLDGPCRNSAALEAAVRQVQPDPLPQSKSGQLDAPGRQARLTHTTERGVIAMDEVEVNAEFAFSAMYALLKAKPWLNRPGEALALDAAHEADAVAFLRALRDSNCDGWGDLPPAAQATANALLLDFLLKVKTPGTPLAAAKWRVNRRDPAWRQALSIVAHEIDRSHPHLSGPRQ